MSKREIKLLPFHPLADKFPLVEGEDFDAIVADIKQNGQRVPIHVYEGQIIDGRTRALACQKLGIAPKYHVIPDGAFDKEGSLVAYVLSQNLHRRHLTAEQKRDVIAELLKADPTKSDRAIAMTAKTDHKTVASVRKEKESRGEVPHVEERKDSKGRSQPARKPAKPALSLVPEPAAPPPLPQPNEQPASKPKPARSWKVEGIAKDGKRYANGVRLGTEAEADAYRLHPVSQVQAPVIIIATRVLPSDDEPDASMLNSKGRVGIGLTFRDGNCASLHWREIDDGWVVRVSKTGGEPSVADKFPPVTGDVLNDRVIASTKPPMTTAPAPGDDGLDIPPSLRREPKVGTDNGSGDRPTESVVR
jgi:ParB-like chromosome segregation protein Spo0J